MNKFLFATVVLIFVSCGTKKQSDPIDEVSEGEIPSVNIDPVFMEDAARITWGSMLSDLRNGKTSSGYTRLNEVLDNLLSEKTNKTQRGESHQGQVEEYRQ